MSNINREKIKQQKLKITDVWNIQEKLGSGSVGTVRKGKVVGFLQTIRFGYFFVCYIIILVKTSFRSILTSGFIIEKQVIIILSSRTTKLTDQIKDTFFFNRTLV